MLKYTVFMLNAIMLTVSAADLSRITASPEIEPSEVEMILNYARAMAEKGAAESQRLDEQLAQSVQQKDPSVRELFPVGRSASPLTSDLREIDAHLDRVRTSGEVTPIDVVELDALVAKAAKSAKEISWYEPFNAQMQRVRLVNALDKQLAPLRSLRSASPLPHAQVQHAALLRAQSSLGLRRAARWADQKDALLGELTLPSSTSFPTIDLED